MVRVVKTRSLIVHLMLLPQPVDNIKPILLPESFFWCLKTRIKPMDGGITNCISFECQKFYSNVQTLLCANRFLSCDSLIIPLRCVIQGLGVLNKGRLYSCELAAGGSSNPLQYRNPVLPMKNTFTKFTWHVALHLFWRGAS